MMMMVCRSVDITKWEAYAKSLAYLSRHFEPSEYLEPGFVNHGAEVESLKPALEMWGNFRVHEMECHLDAMDEFASDSPEELYAKSPLIQKQKTNRVEAFPCLLVVTGSRHRFLKVSQLK